jgi:hypothetical protein
MTNRFDDYFNNTSIRAVCTKTGLNFRDLIKLYHNNIKGAHKDFRKAKTANFPSANLFQGNIFASYVGRLEECIKLIDEVSTNLAIALLSPEEIIREIASEIIQDADFPIKTKIEYKNLLIELGVNNESNS